MEKFFVEYWPVATFMFAMVAYMVKLYIDNTMMKFSKQVAEEMSKEIKDLFNMTSKGLRASDQNLKDAVNNIEIQIKDLRNQIQYIKDNYKKDS